MLIIIARNLPLQDKRDEVLGILCTDRRHQYAPLGSADVTNPRLQVTNISACVG